MKPITCEVWLQTGLQQKENHCWHPTARGELSQHPSQKEGPYRW